MGRPDAVRFPTSNAGAMEIDNTVIKQEIPGSPWDHTETQAAKQNTEIRRKKRTSSVVVFDMQFDHIGNNGEILNRVERNHIRIVSTLTERPVHQYTISYRINRRAVTV